MPTSTSGLAGSVAMDAIFTQYNPTKGLVDAVGVANAVGTLIGTATTGKTQPLTYDSADRPTGGYVYDVFGRQTTVPAAHAPDPGKGNFSLAYFDSDLPQKITQGDTTTTFTLDVSARRLTQTTVTPAGTTTTTRHYADDSDNPAWVDVKEPNGAVETTRFTGSISGDLGATIKTDGVAELTLPNIHGDIVTTVPIPATAATDTPAETIAGWAGYKEYGEAIDPTQAGTVGSPVGYGWLGAKERSTTDATAGLTLMGVRLYNQATGNFTSPDPVPGGNATAYNYPTDPINYIDASGLKKKRKRLKGIKIRKGSHSGPERLTGYTKHGVDRAIGNNSKRMGVSLRVMLDTLKNPETGIKYRKDRRGRESWEYRGKKASVLVNRAGKVVSTWPRSSSAYRGGARVGRTRASSGARGGGGVPMRGGLPLMSWKMSRN